MANGRSHGFDYDAEIEKASSEFEAKQTRKRQIETQIALMNGRVIGAGRLPTAEYRSIVEQQNALKRELGDILSSCSLLKQKIEKLRKSKPGVAKAITEPMSPILREILDELRMIRQKMHDGK